MKTLFTTLLILATLNCFSQKYGFTQADKLTDTAKVDQSFIEENISLKHPGEYLISARNSKMLTWAFALASGGFMYANSKADEPDSKFMIASGAFAAMAVIFEVRSVILIGKAGKSMEVERIKEKQKALSLYANPASAGIKLTF